MLVAAEVQSRVADEYVGVTAKVNLLLWNTLEFIIQQIYSGYPFLKGRFQSNVQLLSLFVLQQYRPQAHHRFVKHLSLFFYLLLNSQITWVD